MGLIAILDLFEYEKKHLLVALGQCESIER
jgi:hypothetical protein